MWTSYNDKNILLLVSKQSKIKSTVHEPNPLSQNIKLKNYNSLQQLILKLEVLRINKNKEACLWY